MRVNGWPAESEDSNTVLKYGNQECVEALVLNTPSVLALL